MTQEEFKKLKVGDKVKLKSATDIGYTKNTEWAKLLGQVVTISKKGDDYIDIEEDRKFCYDIDRIECVVGKSCGLKFHLVLNGVELPIKDLESLTLKEIKEDWLDRINGLELKIY